MTTPQTTTADLIKRYAEKQRAEAYGEDETPPAILLAIAEATDPAETCALGTALMIRMDALSDPRCRIGGSDVDPERAEIADRLGYRG